MLIVYLLQVARPPHGRDDPLELARPENVVLQVRHTIGLERWTNRLTLHAPPWGSRLRELNKVRRGPLVA